MALHGTPEARAARWDAALDCLRRGEFLCACARLERGAEARRILAMAAGWFGRAIALIGGAS